MNFIETRPTVSAFWANTPVVAPWIVPPEPTVPLLLPRTKKDPVVESSFRPTEAPLLETLSRFTLSAVFSRSTAVPLVA